MKKILLVGVLLIPLMLIVVPVGYVGNPPNPGPNEKFVGPAIVGAIQITPSETTSGYVTAYFSGQCSGRQFTMGPHDFGGTPFNDVTPESIEGQTLGYVDQGDYPIPLDCAPSKGAYGTEARIFNVTHFTKIGNVITAHIVALFVVFK